MFVVQSLTERAQARTGLLREAANAHAEAAAAHEAKLQAEIVTAREIQRVKEVIAPGAEGGGRPEEEAGGCRAEGHGRSF
jgi:hypothetical protein